MTSEYSQPFELPHQGGIQPAPEILAPSEITGDWTEPDVVVVPVDELSAEVSFPESISADAINTEDTTQESKYRLGRVFRAGLQDIKDDEHKVAAGVLVVATGITQAIDRSRSVLILGPQLALEAAEHSGHSVVGGLAIAGLFAAVNFPVGETLTQSMDRFPQAKEQFSEEYPKTVQLFKDALPDTLPQEEADTRKQAALRAVQRAWIGIGIGSTAFVATSSVSGESKTDVRDINVKVTRDTSILITVLGTGVIEGIKRMYAAGWYDAANWVNDRANDSKTWVGFALLTMGANFFSNRRAKKKMDLTPAPHDDSADTNELS